MSIFDSEQRFLNFCQSFRNLSNSQSLQDLFALYCKGPRPGYFLEFGMANGSKLSNTLLLELMGWNGLGGEPNPQLRDEAMRRRSIPIAPEALHSTSGKKIRFQCDGLYGGIESAISTDRQAPQSGSTSIIEASTITIKDLLDREKAPRKIHYFSLDIEGAEEIVLKNLPIDRYRFHTLTVEHNYSKRREEIRKIMVGHGFKRVFRNISGHDDWYVNRKIRFRGWSHQLFKRIDGQRGSIHLAQCLKSRNQELAITNLYAVIYSQTKPHPRSFMDLTSILRQSDRLLEAKEIITRGVTIYPDNQRLASILAEIVSAADLDLP